MAADGNTLPSASEIEQQLSFEIPSEARSRYYACLVGSLAVHVSSSNFLSAVETALDHTPVSSTRREYLQTIVDAYRKQVRA